jgi:hypothetical protein
MQDLGITINNKRLDRIIFYDYPNVMLLSLQIGQKKTLTVKARVLLNNILKYLTQFKCYG